MAAAPDRPRRGVPVNVARGVLAAGLLLVLVLGLLPGSAGTAPASASGSMPEGSTTVLGSRTPASTKVVADPDPVELGLQFSVAGSGKLLGLRYFRGTADRPAHPARLWSDSGARLASLTFPASTSSGWQYAAFATPVTLREGRYTASYHTRVGYLSTHGYFTGTRTRGPLTTRASAGVYRYASGSAFPERSYRSSNYWIDPVFRPSGTSGPAPTTAPTTTQPTQPAPTTTTSAPTTSPTQPGSEVTGWPDASTTGVSGCPTLKKVDNGDEVKLDQRGQVYENVELMNEAVIRVLAPDVTIRCVKMNGTGWHGIQNSERTSATNVVVDRVDISCKRLTQRIGMLLRDATVSRADVHDCDHMINAGGDNLTVRDSYCHDLTQAPVVHADCIQSLGGNTNLTIRHNSLWGWGTSDVLLGQEYGEVRNAVIDSNRLLSDPDQTPAPAYLFYVSGTNTVVTNNRFTRRSTYGPCTLNTAAKHVTWSGNVWDEDGSPVRLSDC